jgi:ferric iron reductase protein FhuF
MTGFPLLPGAEAALVESLVPLPAEGSLPARLFREDGGPALLLAAARRHRPDAEERALASLWSRWYFAKLIPPVLLCGVMRGLSLPLDASGTAVLFGPQGMPRAIALPDAGEVVPERDPFLLFAPVVAALSAHARLAPRILWNNAAVYADWALRRMAEDSRVPREAVRRAMALVEEPAWPDGRPNPLHAPFTQSASGAAGGRTRRQCCLLYRLPGEGCCGTCPRLAKRLAPPLDENEKHSH